MSPAIASAAAPDVGALAARACTHCGQPVPSARLDADAPAAAPVFCCDGCRTVYGILHAHGLSGFYRVAQAAAARPNRPPDRAAEAQRGYQAWDDPRFQARHARGASDGQQELELFLEGVHCGACAWLIERLPRLVPGVTSARLDLAQARCQLRWDPTQVSLSTVARQLDRLGYAPHPARAGQARAARAGEERRHLVRLAVAGFLAANIMLMAFALYSGEAGMSEGFRALFRLGSLALAIPAVLGPGALFLRGAWSSLRARTLSMDVPIAAALLLGSAWGARNAIRGQGEVFFDTLGVLVFLLLVGRWLERRQRRRAAEESELLQALAPTAARRLEPDGATREVPLEALEPGDQVEVRAGEAIPVDGRVERGESTLDRALLTGESLPAPVSAGDEVAAGVLNLTTPLVITVERAGEETRVARLLRQVEEAARRRAPLVRLADRLAAWFVAAVLVLSALTLAVWWSTSPDLAVDHAVALLVVTCPCALALATPLAVSVAIGVAARRGVVVRGGDALERLSAPGRGGLRVWLDKTGTLTEGRARLLRWAGEEAVQPLVLGLERGSAHPLARGFEDALGPRCPEPPGCDEPARRGGQGICGRVGGRALRIGAPEWIRAGAAGPEPAWVEPFLSAALAEAATPVLVEVEGRIAAGAAFGDPLRPEARAAVAWLRAQGHRVGILSGDHPRVVEAIGRQLGLDPAECLGAQTPEDKLARVEHSRAAGPVLMVGDGVNDAAALAAASVGVGVRGGAEAVLACADVFLSRPGLAPLIELMQGAGSTLRTIRRNLALSLAYNAVAATLALSGVLSPLVAALLMPLSSLSVIGSSTRAWRAAGLPERPAPGEGGPWRS